MLARKPKMLVTVALANTGSVPAPLHVETSLGLNPSIRHWRLRITL